MKNFENFGLSDALNHSLEKMKYTEPTPIQEKAIPLALEGKDILGSAQTGTGKTAAFSIPLVEALLKSPHGSAMVLTPTRELAKQVLEVIHQLIGYRSPIKTAFIIGGESMGKQLAQLKQKPRIIVGTPGRINDHLERGSMKLHETGFLVLDETDRMLDMGFGIQLDRIIKYLPKKRQTLMFSATLPQGIVKLSSKYLHNPERVSMGDTNVVAQNIKQEVIRIEQSDKYKELMGQLHERTGSVIIFIKTKHGADRMAKNLRRDGFTSEALHGDLRQNKRDKVMKNFKSQNFRILVATDIAARGLDVPHIEHVINYDLPQVAEDYIHRMGRTARAGATGSAISFVSAQDGRKWHAIEVLLDPSAAKKKSFPAEGKNKNSRRKPYRGRPSKGDSQGSEGKYNKKPKAFHGKPRRDESSEEGFKKSKSFHGKPKRDERSEEGFKKPKSFHGKPKRDERSEEGFKKSKSFHGKPRRDERSDEQSNRPARPAHKSQGKYNPEEGLKRKGRPDGKPTRNGRPDEKSKRPNSRPHGKPNANGKPKKQWSDNKPHKKAA